MSDKQDKDKQHVTPKTWARDVNSLFQPQFDQLARRLQIWLRQHTDILRRDIEGAAQRLEQHINSRIPANQSPSSSANTSLRNNSVNQSTNSGPNAQNATSHDAGHQSTSAVEATNHNSRAGQHRRPTSYANLGGPQAGAATAISLSQQISRLTREQRLQLFANSLDDDVRSEFLTSERWNPRANRNPSPPSPSEEILFPPDESIDDPNWVLNLRERERRLAIQNRRGGQSRSAGDATFANDSRIPGDSQSSSISANATLRDNGFNQSSSAGKGASGLEEPSRNSGTSTRQHQSKFDHYSEEESKRITDNYVRFRNSGFNAMVSQHRLTNSQTMARSTSTTDINRDQNRATQDFNSINNPQADNGHNNGSQTPRPRTTTGAREPQRRATVENESISKGGSMPPPARPNRATSGDNRDVLGEEEEEETPPVPVIRKRNKKRNHADDEGSGKRINPPAL